MSNNVIREIRDPIITTLSNDIRETMVHSYRVLSCYICMNKWSTVIAKQNEVYYSWIYYAIMNSIVSFCNKYLDYWF